MFNDIKNRLKAFRQLQIEGLTTKQSLPNGQVNVVCPNCGNHFVGKFCPQCGQSAATKRITFRDTIHNILTAFLAGDDTFFRTCRDLLWRPGYMVYDYLSGRRVNYFRPIHMLVRLVAIYVLITLFWKDIAPQDTNISDVFMSNVHSPSLTTVLTHFFAILKNKVIGVLLLSVVCVWPYWRVFKHCTIHRKNAYAKHLNMSEHYCTIVYFSCAKMIVAFLLFIPGMLDFFAPYKTTVDYLIGFFIPIFTYRQLYNISWLKSIWLTLWAIILTMALFSLIIMFGFGLFYGLDAVI